MDKTTLIDVSEIPAEVHAAAHLVETYAKTQGWRNWKLHGLQSRDTSKGDYAILYLTGEFDSERFDTLGELWAAMDRATKSQVPYMTFRLKSRNGHIGPVWHPAETRYFDPRRG